MTRGETAVGRTIRTNHDKENPYFMLARATAQDKRISYEALGVLTYLLSQSDKWEVRVGELAQRGKGEKKQGLTRIYRILKELRAAGYVVLEAEYVKGKIVNWMYHIHERPIDDLVNRFLQVEKLNVENDSPNKDKEGMNTKKEIPISAQNAEADRPNSSVKGEEPNPPKTKTKTPKPPTAARSPLSPTERDALFEAVALHVFRVTSKEELKEMQESDNAATRAGMISNWLARGTNKFRNKEVGFISSPATPDHVIKFAKWHASAKPKISIPWDGEKFVDAWREWASSQRKQIAPRPTAPAAPSVSLTPEQLQQRQNDLKAIRNGVKEHE